MRHDHAIGLTLDEVRKAFSDPAWAGKYPPILTLAEAAELARVPLETVRSWRSQRVLDTCSTKVGKHVRVYRDRFILWLFAGGPSARQERRSRRST